MDLSWLPVVPLVASLFGVGGHADAASVSYQGYSAPTQVGSVVCSQAPFFYSASDYGGQALYYAYDEAAYSGNGYGDYALTVDGLPVRDPALAAALVNTLPPGYQRGSAPLYLRQVQSQGLPCSPLADYSSASAYAYAGGARNGTTYTVIGNSYSPPQGPAKDIYVISPQYPPCCVKAVATYTPTPTPVPSPTPSLAPTPPPTLPKTGPGEVLGGGVQLLGLGMSGLALRRLLALWKLKRRARAIDIV